MYWILHFFFWPLILIRFENHSEELVLYNGFQGKVWGWDKTRVEAYWSWHLIDGECWSEYKWKPVLYHAGTVPIIGWYDNFYAVMLRLFFTTICAVFNFSSYLICIKVILSSKLFCLTMVCLSCIQCGLMDLWYVDFRSYLHETSVHRSVTYWNIWRLKNNSCYNTISLWFCYEDFMIWHAHAIWI